MRQLVSTVIALFLLVSCDKWDYPALSLPPEIFCMPFDTATGVIHANISGVKQPIKQHGHCWARHSAPTLLDDKTLYGPLSGNTDFSSLVETNRECGAYYFRAYYVDERDSVHYSNQEIYLIKSNCWNHFGDFPGDSISFHQPLEVWSPATGTIVLLLGSSSKEVWTYRKNLGFERKADFPGEPRSGGLTMYGGGKEFFGFGVDFDNNEYVNDFWQYDFPTDTWTLYPIPNIHNRINMIGTVKDSCLYMGLGWYISLNQGGPVIASHYDDFKKNCDSVWQNLPELTDFVVGATYQRYNDLLVSVGQSWFDQGLFFSIYDFDLELWTQKGKITSTYKSLPASFIIDDNFYVTLGGSSESWKFNFPSSTWTRVADFPEGGYGVGWSLYNTPFVLNTTTKKLWVYLK